MSHHLKFSVDPAQEAAYTAISFGSKADRMVAARLAVLRRVIEIEDVVGYGTP